MRHYVDQIDAYLRYERCRPKPLTYIEVGPHLQIEVRFSEQGDYIGNIVGFIVHERTVLPVFQSDDVEDGSPRIMTTASLAAITVVTDFFGDAGEDDDEEDDHPGRVRWPLTTAPTDEDLSR